MIEEQSSCLVTTGDKKGHFWVCTVWSSLVDGERMATCGKEIPPTLHLFIHSQPIGRCLVSLHLLGHLCEKLSGVYKDIVKSLDIIVELGVRSSLVELFSPTLTYFDSSKIFSFTATALIEKPKLRCPSWRKCFGVLKHSVSLKTTLVRPFMSRARLQAIWKTQF
jgi:hypothetical protein